MVLSFLVCLKVFYDFFHSNVWRNLSLNKWKNAPLLRELLNFKRIRIDRGLISRGGSCGSNGKCRSYLGRWSVKAIGRQWHWSKCVAVSVSYLDVPQITRSTGQSIINGQSFAASERFVSQPISTPPEITNDKTLILGLFRFRWRTHAHTQSSCTFNGTRVLLPWARILDDITWLVVGIGFRLDMCYCVGFGWMKGWLVGWVTWVLVSGRTTKITNRYQLCCLTDEQQDLIGTIATGDDDDDEDVDVEDGLVVGLGGCQVGSAWVEWMVNRARI